MFKNLTPYRLELTRPLAGTCLDRRDHLQELLSLQTFAPTAPTQELSAGWIAPDKDQPDLLANRINGELLACLQIETRRVPAQAIAEHVEAAAQHIERDTGRKPGAKRCKELKEEACLTLLPRAFPRRKRINVWLSRKLGMLIIGSTSASDCDTVLTALVRSIGAPEDSGVSIQPLLTDMEPDVWMTYAVQMRNAGRFELEDTLCEMRDTDPIGTSEAITYKKIWTEADDLRDRAARLTVTRLSMSYQDRVILTLTDRLQLRNVDLLGEPPADAHQRADTGYGVDAFLWTAELTPVLQALLDELTTTEQPA
jgi:recombination associated protein RdgC